MKTNLRCGDALRPSDFWELRKRVAFECCKWDLHSEDREVLARFPLVISRQDWNDIAAKAELLTSEVLRAEPGVLACPNLIDQLGLPRPIASLLKRPHENGHCAQIARVMRFDFHPTPEGWRVSEVNSDVPGGFIEGGGFTRLMAEHYSAYSAPVDPAASYAQALSEGLRVGSLVGMVYATGYSDDHQVMQYLGGYLVARGMRVAMVSPSHLRWQAGHAIIDPESDRRMPDALVRFFPGEWLPEMRNADRWQGYFRGGRTPQSNPGVSLVSQSKRLPLIWDQLKSGMDTWLASLPETRSVTNISRNQLDEWVVKPALGRVGEDVAISGITDLRAMGRIIQAAFRHPEDWIAQRRFTPIAVEGPDGPIYPCIGLFTIDGRAAGMYGRIASKALIDAHAQDVAVLIEGLSED